jgi:predicted HTH transcriptional regulator
MFEKEIKKLQEVLKISKACNNNELYWIEFKTNFVDENSKLNLFGQNISGIANSCTYHKRDFGYIICGIEDQTLVEKGVDFDPFNMKVGNQDLELILRSKLVGVDFELFPFKKNDKNFLIIEISKSQGQVSSLDKIQYFRQGKNIKKLSDCSPETQLKMVYSIRNSQFWNKPVIDKISKNEILNLLHYDVYYLKQKKPIPTNIDNVIVDFLDEGFLVKNENIYDITLLGGILFARDLFKIDELLDKRVRIITFKTRSKIDGYTNDIYGHKGYIASFEDMINYILSQIPEDQIVEGISRKHQHKFSLVGIREFLANTLIH